MFFRKTVAPVATLDDRRVLANVSADAHLSMFETAAAGLESAANALDDIRAEAADEAARHTRTKLDAEKAAFNHRATAQKIRDLIG